MINFIICFHTQRFSFKLNFIPGWDSRVNGNFFISRWGFISVTCKRTLSITCYYYFVTKNLLTIESYNYTEKNIPKQGSSKSLYCKEMVNVVITKAFRNSRSQLLYKIGFLEHFAKFTGKHLCWSHFLTKFQT